jgi:hypothetical protein
MHAQLTQIRQHGLLLVEKGSHVEVHQRGKVLSFDTDSSRAVKKALEKIEEKRLRELKDDTEPVLKFPTKGSYEDHDQLKGDELPKVKKSVVKDKYRQKYKANGYHCGDEIAEELRLYVCQMVGNRLAVIAEKLREVAEKNLVWETRYEALNMGLRRMAIGNKLRARLEAGEPVDIGGCLFQKSWE